jgi:HK97 family phage major capsid protein
MKEQRANITANIRSIIDEYENKDMDQTKTDELRKLENEFDKLNSDILTREKQIDRERIAGENQNNQSENREKDPDKEKRDLFANYLKEGTKAAENEYRALQQDNPNQAGYLIAPEQFVNELISTLDNDLFFRKLAKVLPTLKNAKSLGYPTRTARMNSAAWGTELSAPTPDTTLAFGKREFKLNPATAEILISKTLIRNASNVDGIVRSELAYDLGELIENAYMTGNGVGKPLGIFVASNDGIPTTRDISTGNTATEMKFDGLMEAKYSLKQQYQKNLSWIFHRDGVKKLAKLKDANGQYIWQQSVVVGTPDRLLTFPVNMSEYAPNTFTTGQYVGMLGDYKNYWIVDGLMMEIQALFELYARTNQVDYIAMLETEGAPVVSEAFARIKLG